MIDFTVSITKFIKCMINLSHSFDQPILGFVKANLKFLSFAFKVCLLGFSQVHFSLAFVYSLFTVTSPFILNH